MLVAYTGRRAAPPSWRRSRACGPGLRIARSSDGGSIVDPVAVTCLQLLLLPGVGARARRAIGVADRARRPPPASLRPPRSPDRGAVSTRPSARSARRPRLGRARARPSARVRQLRAAKMASIWALFCALTSAAGDSGAPPPAQRRRGTSSSTCAPGKARRTSPGPTRRPNEPFLEGVWWIWQKVELTHLVYGSPG